MKPYTQYSFENSNYEDSTVIKVLIPDNYHLSGERRYPALYVFDAQWEEMLWYVQSVVSFLGSCGYPGFIVVGILTKDRRRMFTPPGSDLLQDFIESHVMPFINNNFRTNGMNIAFGHSLSATFITCCFIKSPSLFNAYLANSPNYINDDWQIDRLLKERMLDLPRPRLLYIAYGSGDSIEDKFEPGIKKINTILNELAPPHLMWKVESLENFSSHGTTPLPGTMKGLEFFHKSIRLAITPDITFSDIKTFYHNHLTEWLGFKVNPDPSEINTLGYELLCMDRKELSLEVFDWAIELYPQNYNLFDSRGEVKEHLLQFESAEADYRNAMQLLIEEFETNKINEQTYNEGFSWITERLNNLETKMSLEK